MQTETNGDCEKCRKHSYCKKQCRANREFVRQKIKDTITDFMVRKMLERETNEEADGSGGKEEG